MAFIAVALSLRGRGGTFVEQRGGEDSDIHTAVQGAVLRSVIRNDRFLVSAALGVQSASARQGRREDSHDGIRACLGQSPVRREACGENPFFTVTGPVVLLSASAIRVSSG